MHFVSRWGAPDIGLPGVTVNSLITPLPAKQEMRCFIASNQTAGFK
jgi:hypothetical protein